MLNNLRSRNRILSLPYSKTHAHSATWYHHHYLRLDLEGKVHIPSVLVV